MKQLNEKLLDSWLRLSVAICNEKIVSELPYNESLICNLLYRRQLQQPETPMTATDLCQATKMLKSQMNRTLGSMEEKGLICRERSATDKRQIFVRLNMEHIKTYEDQHAQILQLIDTLLVKIGNEKAAAILDAFNTLSEAAEEVIK